GGSGAVETPGYYVAQFYSDVDMLQATATVTALGITIQPNTSLLTTQLLAIGTTDQMVALTAYDIVEYVFPASPELIQGIPTIPCQSGETSYGPLMAMAASIAGGWSQDSNGVANLTWSLGPTPANIAIETIQALFIQAQQQWGSAVLLNFTQASDETANRNVDLGFYSYAHGDSYPFDGPGGVLAHTFFPAPPNQEPIAGDMHLDASEAWTTDGSGGTDFYSVALHELGHALGMNHTTGPLDVMYPFYRKNVTFSPTDIAQIQSLYSPQTASATPPVTTFPPPASLTITVQVPSNQVTSPTTSLSGTTTGGEGTVQVTWATDRGAFGTADGSATWTVASVTLAEGLNTITVTATDSAANTATQSLVVAYTAAPPPSLTPPPTTTTAPVITITSPAGGTLSTTSTTADIQGTASSSAGIRSISWQTSNGASGAAQGTASWDTGPIGLQTGINVVTINAVGLDGGTSSAVVQITVAAPQSPPPSGGGGGGGSGGGSDTTPPTLTIVSPSSTSVYTSDATVTITGTATDNVGVASVRWDGVLGGAVASGTTSWSTGPITLLVGMNNIVIHAYDAAGNSSWRSVIVTKQ
ncbi:MAG TPA: matrixin family metalloprotease, partial [Bryobacteraceae bacterium]